MLWHFGVIVLDEVDCVSDRGVLVELEDLGDGKVKSGLRVGELLDGLNLGARFVDEVVLGQPVAFVPDGRADLLQVGGVVDGLNVVEVQVIPCRMYLKTFGNIRICRF